MAERGVRSRRRQPPGPGLLGHEADRRVLHPGAGHAPDQDDQPARRRGPALLLRHGRRQRACVLLVPRRPTVTGAEMPGTVPGLGEWTSAVGSMNHVAFNVPEERFLEYRAKLKGKGVRVSPILDHADSEMGVAREFHPGVFVRSFYFQDPDGIVLEFACWRRAMGQPGDVRHQPKTAADRTGIPA